MLDGAVRIATRYLAVADWLLPGRIIGFYLVGSAALDAWRPERSDVDFVAVVDGDLTDGDVRRLRVLHVAGNAATVGRALIRARPTIPETMNGVFVSADELGEPVTRIRPLASHSGRSFKRGSGFDVNPVMWKVLLERGITMRGPSPDALGLDPEPGLLRAWNLDQLHGHWRTFAEQILSGNPPRKPPVPAHLVAVTRLFGPPRLHRTIATGEVISKEAAAEYALDTFAARWHTLIRTALAWRTRQPVPSGLEPGRLLQLTGEFIHELIADADRL
jgi:hypothetical protein